jgi:HEAT repeat protein
MVAADDPSDDELIEMVTTLLTDSDKDVRALGLEQVRTAAKGPAATQKFAALLPKLPSEAQVGLLSALADRGDATARSAVLDVLGSSRDEAVRVAAISALGWLGGPTEIQAILPKLWQGAAAEKAAARTSLVRLKGDTVAKLVAAELANASPPQQVTLLEILSERRALDTIPDMLAAANSNEVGVREAAMIALGQLAATGHLPGLLQGVLKAEPGREREAAEKAVMQVCARVEDLDQRSAAALAAVEGLGDKERLALLPTLGRVGGEPILKVLETAVADPSPAVHEAGIRALCNWPDASLAPRLIELTRAEKHAEHRTRALRALIRIAVLPDGRPDTDKLALLRTAWDVCEQDAERNLILQRAQAIRHIETLRFLWPYLDQPKYAQQACQSLVELAHHRKLRDDNKAEFHAALDKVLSTSTDATVKERATRYKKGQTWVRPAENRN